MSRVPWWALLSSAAAPILLIGGWTVAAAVQPAPFDSVVRTISDLAAGDASHRLVMTVALLGVGVSHVVTARGLRPAASAGRLVLGLGGLATLLVAAFPLPSEGGSSSAHTAAALVSFVSLAAWPAFGGLRQPQQEAAVPALLHRRVSAAAAVALVVAVAWFFTQLLTSGSLVGLSERVAAGAQSLWPLAVVLSARRTQNRQTHARRLQTRQTR